MKAFTTSEILTPYQEQMLHVVNAAFEAGFYLGILSGFLSGVMACLFFFWLGELRVVRLLFARLARKLRQT